MVFFNSCKNEIDEVIEEEVQSLEIPLPQSDLVDLSLYNPDLRPVNTSVVGIITDEDNMPIEGALVKLAGDEYLSDELGRFTAINVTLNSRGSVYTVEKAGYYKGIRRFKPQADAVEQTRVQLKKKSIIGSFNATIGGTVTTADGLSITFPANAIVDANGNLVFGNVNVAAAWIDPRISEQLPGSLFGLNSAVEEVSLISYSMAAVELSASGQEVNIAPETYATIEFPIPVDIRSSAPEEIPLWSLEEELGLWIEEGVAIKEGNKYIGNVSHFSFWNCDVAPDRVDVMGMVLNQNEVAVAGIKVKATSPNFGVIGTAITNSLGFFGGQLPRGEIIKLEFENGDCESREMEVGPFDGNTFLGDIVLEMELGTIRGRVTDCEGAILQNAFVEIESSSFLIPTYTNLDGEFSAGYSTLCDLPSAIFVQASVDGTLFQSEQQVEIPSETVDFGDVAVCDEVDNFQTGVGGGMTCGVGIGGVSVPTNNLTALGYVSTEGEFGKLKLLVSSDLFGFQVTTLFPLVDPSAGQYDPENWDLAVDTSLPLDFFSFSRQVSGEASADPTVLYNCGPGVDETIDNAVYFPICDDVEFSITDLSLNPIANGDFALMQSGDFITCRIQGTLPNGESLEIDLHKVF